jgi:hypothetical protein
MAADVGLHGGRILRLLLLVAEEIGHRLGQRLIVELGPVPAIGVDAADIETGRLHLLRQGLGLLRQRVALLLQLLALVVG